MTWILGQMQIVTIIRGKKGATPLQRLDKILSRQLFQQLASRREKILSNITIIDAEICAADCGINEKDLHNLAG